MTIEIPGFNKSLYKRAIKGIRVSEIAYPFEHCGLVHMLFQYNQHISYEELEMQLMDNRCNWLFDDRQIRQRVNDYFLDEFLLDQMGV